MTAPWDHDGATTGLGAATTGLGAAGARRPMRLTDARRARYLFEDSPVGIALLDLNGVIVDLNGAFARAMSVDDKAALGRPFVDGISREDRDDVRGQLSKLVMGAVPAAQIADVRLAGNGGGDRRLSVFARRIDDLGEPVGFVVHLLDVSAQRAIESRLAQSQRMEAIGQLAGGIAHDFNNLLTAMLGFCDLLLARFAPGDPSSEDALQIRANALRGSALVRQLLAYSRRQTLAPVVVRVDAALGELSKMLARLLGPHIPLRLECASADACVSVDPGQFDQVIVNLAVNARDAMPAGGALTIRTQALELAQPTQRGGEVIPPGAYVLVEVADSGSGIPKEIIGNIFEPFFSTKPPGAGTGLGLATVYGIVRQTNGYIFVDSAPGEGAVFSIVLPAAAAERAAASPPAGSDPQAAPSPCAAAARPATILLVEDEASVRLLASRTLKRQGYEVVETDSGETALSLLAANDAIDVLLSDVIMPGLDGRHLVRLARERRPSLRVILMSGYAEHEVGADVPTARFLQKPFSITELTNAVASALAG